MTELKKTKTLEEIVALFKTQDQLAVPLATGQPISLLNALGEKNDWDQLEIFCGLTGFP